MSGYHWHFLSDDRQIGGHVLACDFAEGTLRYDECTSILIHVPTSGRFDRFDVESIQDDDIRKIERQRTKAE